MTTIDVTPNSTELEVDFILVNIGPVGNETASQRMTVDEIRVKSSQEVITDQDSRAENLDIELLNHYNS